MVVSGRFDAADDWIVEQAGATDIAITSDIPLASRCLKKGSRVLDPKGRVFTDDSIGDAPGQPRTERLPAGHGRNGGRPQALFPPGTAPSS